MYYNCLFVAVFFILVNVNGHVLISQATKDQIKDKDLFEQALKEAEGLLNRKGWSLGNHIYYFTYIFFLFYSQV